jgi:hypothetical protein
MSVVIKSNKAFAGNPALLPTELAPLPLGAAYYHDYVKNLFVGHLTEGGQGKNTTLLNNLTMGGGVTVDALGELENSTGRYFKNGQSLGIIATGNSNTALNSPLDLTNSAWVKTAVTVAQKSSEYSPHLLTASAGSGSKASISQTIPQIISTAAVYAFAKKDTARYLMIEVTGSANSFAVYDLESETVTNVGSLITYAKIIQRGNYLQCAFGISNGAALAGDVKYSIVKSPTAKPGDTFTYDGTETMYLGPVNVDQSAQTARMPTPGARADRNISITQKTAVNNAITVFVKAKLSEMAVYGSPARIVEIGTGSGSIAVGFNTIGAATDPLGLNIAESSTTIDATQTVIASTSDALWNSDEVVTVGVCLSGNKVTVVHKDVVLEATHPTLSESWVLSAVRIGRFSDSFMQKYIQFNGVKTLAEMQSFLKTL